MKDNDSRLPFLDLLRALASQAIVWHHLAFYGPLSDSAHEVATQLIDGLAQHARFAVQVFFVVSGYLSALGLNGREPSRLRDFFETIAGRYRRIGLPYLGALVLAICANELARQWMTNPSISSRPTVPQLVAHALLIHDLFGYEPLSAGIWYLAIDLQLIALLALAFWVCARLAGPVRGRVAARTLVGCLGVVSLFWFNRHPSLDRVAIYFLGSYALGLLAAWAQTELVPRVFFWGYALLLVAAVSLDFRGRLVVALGTAVLLMAGEHFGWLSSWPRWRAVRWLAGISYSLFLVHFPVSLVVNAFWSSHVLATPWLSLLGMLTAYGLSMAVAVLFHYKVERWLLALGRTARPLPRVEVHALLESQSEASES